MRRKKERSKVKQRNKAKQHSTVTFPRKNELPQVGLEPTTLYTLDRALYQLSYRGSSAGWAQISHLIVHLMNRLTNMYMYMLLSLSLTHSEVLYKSHIHVHVIFMYSCFSSCFNKVIITNFHILLQVMMISHQMWSFQPMVG